MERQLSNQLSSPVAPGHSCAGASVDVYDRNALLSRLSLADDVTCAGLALLDTMAPRPRDAVGLGWASLGASRAVAAAAAFIERPTEEVKAVASQLLALCERVQVELDTTGTAEVHSTRGRRLANHPGWHMCITLGTADAAERESAFVLGGLLLLMAAHKGRPVTRAQADSVRRQAVTGDLSLEQLRGLLHADIDAAQTQWPWLAPMQRKWPATQNALVQDAIVPIAAPDFHERARGQLFGRAHYASPARRAGVVTARDLSEGQFVQACAQVGRWIDEDDWRGAFAFLAATSSLTVDLLAEMPLADAVDATWATCLDLDAGTQKFDVEFLVQQAAAMPREGAAVPACFVIEKPLAARLVQNMRARRERFPHAATLGDLYPEAAATVTGYSELMPDGGEIRCSWARWTNSSGLYMRRTGMDNLLASIVSGDFGHVPASKLYYAVVGQDEIWQAASKFFREAGWGEAVPTPTRRLGFGSRVVPTDDALRQAAAWHREQVQAALPSRRERSLARLLGFHNKYVSLIGFELALVLGLREVRQYDLWADIDEAQDRWVEVSDKGVPGPLGALPVPLSPRARQAIRLYRSHCHAVADRLASLGQAGCGAHQWLLSVCRGERVGLLCRLTSVDGVNRAGSADAIGVLPTHLSIAPDAGRKWLENALRHWGVRTGDIDATLRHEVIGQSRFCSVSDFIPIEWAVRTGRAIDSIAAPVLGIATSGLARRSA